MDPTANEKEQRTIAARILEGKATLDDIERLAFLIEALSEWISKGGFLPNPWDNAQRDAMRERIAARRKS